MAEYFDQVEFDVQDLKKLFSAAAEYVKTLRNISDEGKLQFYALYKQANEGPCRTSRPGFWDVVGRAKWDSWKMLGDMSQEEAVELYIQKVFETDPDWEAKYITLDNLNSKGRDEKPAQKQTMGLAVSTLRRNDDEDEIISDANKSIFDWCKEGNVKKMIALLKSREQINSKDDQGMTLLHWACDRGHDDVVRSLVEHKADINSQDVDGQTPLHYGIQPSQLRCAAATCDFVSIVKELLESGADSSITDKDGCLPIDAAESTTVKELLQNAKKNFIKS